MWRQNALVQAQALRFDVRGDWSPWEIATSCIYFPSDLFHNRFTVDLFDTGILWIQHGVNTIHSRNNSCRHIKPVQRGGP